MTYMYLTEDSANLQYNLNAVYPKICFRKRTKCNSRGGKIQTSSGGEYTSRPPYYYYIRHHTKLFVINNHLSSLHTRYSMVSFLCGWPPTDEFLKKDLVANNSVTLILLSDTYV